MDRVGKRVAWICIFSTLLMGCYSSVVVRPKELENGRIASEDLEYVVTRDSSRYDFRIPPQIHERALVGLAVPSLSYSPEGQKVSIPLAEVTQTGMSTTGSITYVVLKNGKRYTFDKPPSVVDKRVVGVAKVVGPGEPPMTRVSIPLSDITSLSVSQPDAGKTGAAIIGVIFVGGLLFVGILAAGLSSTM